MLSNSHSCTAENSSSQSQTLHIFPHAPQPSISWMSAFEIDSNAHDSPFRSMACSPGTPNPTWETRYAELLQWRSEHGDTCVPKAEGALGRWVARQRELRRTGSTFPKLLQIFLRFPGTLAIDTNPYHFVRILPSSAELDSTREQTLNSISFVWNTVTAMWEERFRRLCEWKAGHGHCAVPIAQGELGTWVSKQRQLRKRGKLSKEKIDALNSLDFTWSTAEADWEDKFKRLCHWASERGHASVPFNEGELGWWVNTQRQCKRKGKLSPTREARLRSLGFVWNPSNSRSRQNNQTDISSAVTTPSSTPEKTEKNFLHTDPNIILQLFADAKEEPNLYSHYPSPISAEHLACLEATPPPPLAVEPLVSPTPGMLGSSLWSPIAMTSPTLPSFLNHIPNMNPMNSGFPLQMTAPQSILSFCQPSTAQSHSDALEQLLSRGDHGIEQRGPAGDSLVDAEGEALDEHIL